VLLCRAEPAPRLPSPPRAARPSPLLLLRCAASQEAWTCNEPPPVVSRGDSESDSAGDEALQQWTYERWAAHKEANELLALPKHVAAFELAVEQVTAWFSLSEQQVAVLRGGRDALAQAEFTLRASYIRAYYIARRARRLAAAAKASAARAAAAAAAAAEPDADAASAAAAAAAAPAAAAPSTKRSKVGSGGAPRRAGSHGASPPAPVSRAALRATAAAAAGAGSAAAAAAADGASAGAAAAAAAAQRLADAAAADAAASAETETVLRLFRAQQGQLEGHTDLLHELMKPESLRKALQLPLAAALMTPQPPAGSAAAAGAPPERQAMARAEAERAVAAARADAAACGLAPAAAAAVAQPPGKRSEEGEAALQADVWGPLAIKIESTSSVLLRFAYNVVSFVESAES
jgi:hypothetical protein